MEHEGLDNERTYRRPLPKVNVSHLFFLPPQKADPRMQEATRHVLRLCLLASPGILVSVAAWVLLLLGPGVVLLGTDCPGLQFDLGIVVLCLVAQGLGVTWTIACGVVYVDRSLEAKLIVQRVQRIDRLRDLLAKHGIQLQDSLEPARAETPTTSARGLDAAIEDYDRTLEMGRAGGRRELALCVLGCIVPLYDGGVGKRTPTRQQLEDSLEDVCLQCSDALGMQARRDNEALPAELREVLREMRYRQGQRQRQLELAETKHKGKAKKTPAPHEDASLSFQHLLSEEEDEEQGGAIELQEQ